MRRSLYQRTIVLLLAQSRRLRPVQGRVNMCIFFHLGKSTSLASVSTRWTSRVTHIPQKFVGFCHPTGGLWSSRLFHWTCIRNLHTEQVIPMCGTRGQHYKFNSIPARMLSCVRLEDGIFGSSAVDSEFLATYCRHCTISNNDNTRTPRWHVRIFLLGLVGLTHPSFNGT